MDILGMWVHVMFGLVVSVNNWLIHRVQMMVMLVDIMLMDSVSEKREKILVYHPKAYKIMILMRRDRTLFVSLSEVVEYYPL